MSRSARNIKSIIQSSVSAQHGHSTSTGSSVFGDEDNELSGPFNQMDEDVHSVFEEGEGHNKGKRGVGGMGEVRPLISGNSETLTPQQLMKRVNKMSMLAGELRPFSFC